MKIIRTEIAIETARVIVIRAPGRALARCDACGGEVQWVRLDEAARLAGVGSRETFRMIEGDVLHSTETEAGILLVCLSSLAAVRAPEPPPGSPENRVPHGQCLRYTNTKRRPDNEDIVRQNKEEK